jgi:hypothetical protein
MQKITLSFVSIVLSVLLLYACDSSKSKPASTIQFTELPSSKTGVHFNNTITENDSVNLITNEYLYIGGGVGIGDFNNDNRPDIYFSANQVSSKLYLNKGNFQFEDITEKAGLKSAFWGTGVSIVDINSDGYDDIYVCVSGSKNPALRRNKLYINNKNLTFSEQATNYGLADTSFSTQAFFFDYDKDGDLDMYLLNHLLYDLGPNTIHPPGYKGHLPAADKLFRNDGAIKNGDNPIFKDVTSEAGIHEQGYGLGVIVSDFNDDNWPDVYTGNDYLANDLLWLNNRNKSFSNRIATAMKHQSYSSMGVDAADINNDGLPDVASLDMMPEDNERQKMMYSFMNYERYEMERRTGYQPSFMRNMLQLNNGTRNINDTIEPFFSEIGQLAGIHETDWSWSVLMADLDNDGWKDMHITNGMGRDMLNNDFVIFKAQASGTEYSSKENRIKNVVQKLNEYGTIELQNYCYRNNGDLTFTNVSTEAGVNTFAVSNGCAYADFDNDGDLDLAVNNINKDAFILRNNVPKDSLHNYLIIQLKGDTLNKQGFGTKVKVYTGQTVQLVEQYPVRGYASSVDKRLHIGLGNYARIDSILITWPNDKQQVLKNIQANQMLTIRQTDATLDLYTQPAQKLLFTDITSTSNIQFKHSETFFYDYSFQRLLPQKYSQLGPFITTGDVNGDGLNDFYVGGAYNQSGQFFLQQPGGGFIHKPLIPDTTKDEEDLGCLLFDADGDTDLDLFVNSGGYEYDAGSAYYIPRLYKNNGKGSFTIDPSAIPRSILTSAQAVSGADYDNDGDTDLFIGGRISPNQYPVSPRSYILQNDNGQFSDVTSEVCQALEEIGMVTSAVWTDLNNDKKPELVVTGEWMTIRFFENRNNILEEVTNTTGLRNMHGLWRSLHAVDIDKDGDTDLVAGNLGLNNKYRMEDGESIRLYAKDLDNNGSIDPILSYYIKNKNGERELYPSMGRDRFAEQVPSIRKKYPYHNDYSSKKINDIYTKEDREDMLEFVCEETRSGWIENKGDGKFVFHPLPVEAQFAPVNAITSVDVDGDNHLDIVLAGNEYQAEISTGRYDASYGLVLKGNGQGMFTPLRPIQSGLIVDGDVKDVKVITTGTNQRLVLFAINDEKLKVFKF